MVAASRVVIADDDNDIRELLEVAAARAGLELISSHGDGRSALEAAIASDADLVLLDIAMPELTGIEVTERLRAGRTDGRPRIVLISASVEDAVLESGREAGADEVLGKPFRVKELSEHLRRIAGARS